MYVFNIMSFVLSFPHRQDQFIKNLIKLISEASRPLTAAELPLQYRARFGTVLNRFARAAKRERERERQFRRCIFFLAQMGLQLLPSCPVVAKLMAWPLRRQSTHFGSGPFVDGAPRADAVQRAEGSSGCAVGQVWHCGSPCGGLGLFRSFTFFLPFHGGMLESGHHIEEPRRTGCH